MEPLTESEMDEAVRPAYTYYELTRGKDQAIIENHSYSEKNDAEQLNYEIFSPDGLHFWHQNISSPHKKSLCIENAAPFVQFHFSITSNTQLHREGDKNSFAAFGNHEYNILYIPGQRSIVHRDSDKRTEVFTLNILPDVFLNNLPEEHPLTDHFYRCVKQSKAAALSSYNLPVTPRIKSILYEMLNCPLSNHYKRLYLKAKSVELQLLLFSHFEEYKYEQADETFGLREIDILRAQQAREILHNNIQNPCSLIDLAHQVGTNESYLKKHFKKIFGNTIYGYVQELRMQQARQLLAKEHYTLHEIARLSGYKHTHHFISAFRKYFGYAPAKIKSLLPALCLNSDFSLLYDLALVV